MALTPWHHREAQHGHHRRFEQLLTLHQMTEAWIEALREAGANRPSYSLDRGLPREITDQLWILGSLIPSGFDALLDDTSPEDVLGRLERMAWSVQAYTLSKLLERVRDAELEALRSVLEQTSWKQGRSFAEKRWGQLSDVHRLRLKHLVLTLQETPLGGSPGNEGILATRVTDQETRFQLLHCAHQNPSSEVQPVADRLCDLHAQWLSGFAYGLNPAITTSWDRKKGRCQQIWALNRREARPTSPP